jgi:lipopolysaccharide/colanic/teichoic acid biosynthesis glycosyltransferase
MKRLFDVLFSIFMLTILFIPLLFIALLVWIDSGYPFFFFQERVGQYGKPFRIIKFRTMQVIPGVDKGTFDAGDTSRVTKAGKFLRKYKFDELPQIINVLKGEMSFVGPRPEVKKWTEKYPCRWAKVLQVKPGITDNASLMFRNEEELLAGSDNPEKLYEEKILPQKLDLYENYVADKKFWSDVRILLKTAGLLLR